MQHPIFGSSTQGVFVQKFVPMPEKKGDRLNKKIEINPNEKVGHDRVSKIINSLGIRVFNNYIRYTAS